jgi:TPR repeat protein
VKKLEIATVAVKLTAESFRNVPIPVEDEYFDFKFCNKTFSLPISQIYFLSPTLSEFFLSTGECFDILIEDSDRDNSLFKGIDDNSIVDSFEVLISLLSGFRPSVSDTLYKSLLFLATKLGCLDVLKALNDFQLSHFTTFTFTPSLFSFGDFDFTFRIGYETFNCSAYSAFILSKAAQRLYNDENVSSLTLTVPPNFAKKEDEFVHHFSSFFGLLFGQSIVIDAASFAAFFSISKQIDNAEVLAVVSNFIVSQKSDTLSERLNILSTIDIPNDFEISSIDSLFDDICDNFEIIPSDNLCNILPNNLFKILKSPKLKMESENAKFDFILGYLSVCEERSTFLFESIDFAQLSQSNLKRFFDFVQLSDLNDVLFKSIKEIILTTQLINPNEVKQTAPISESDEINGQFSEGVKHYLGKDVPRDYHKSLKYFQFCASKGHYDALEYLSALHKKGIDVLENYRHALNYIDNPNEEIDCDSLTYIGLLHSWGIALPKDKSKALQYFKAGDAKGSHESTRMIGDCYYYGFAVEENDETAFNYYQRSYARGNLPAALHLADLYRFGDFVQKDESKAFALATEAASKGYSTVLRRVGYYYEDGVGVKQNYSEALKYYTKAMECGCPYAIRSIAWLYKYGHGVAEDKAKADYYKRLFKERGFE